MHQECQYNKKRYEKISINYKYYSKGPVKLEIESRVERPS
jgi:hypothetical protein